uniref:C2 domain containing 3 centriole elongation regulator n=1 Tax=Salarias fasciatus TaxID=181472 RepID=A0A672GQS2_SALFA
MKSRKLRPARAGGGKKKVPSDVSPSTSLPPLVEGQLRCFLRVTISRVLWTVHKPPSPTSVRLRWWGESSNGTQFFPRDGAQLSQKTIKTTACFPIRCGPKQFTSYLTDMGSLVLEVLTKPDHLPIARAQVAGISRLSLSNPISGFYTLVSPTSDKLGELQVSLNLEPLAEAYDSSSSGPPTDVSLEGLQVHTLTVPSQEKSAGSSGANTPRCDAVAVMGLPFIISHLNGKRLWRIRNAQPLSLVSYVFCSNCPYYYFLFSVILERGNKLRNAMVVSALKCEMDSDPTEICFTSFVSFVCRTFPPPPGTFLENILQTDSPVKQSDVLVSDCSLDNRAVDLLLGR